MLSTTETKGTQTLLTVNSLSKLLAFPKMNSTGSQTELSDNVIEVDSIKTPQSHKTDANIEISEEPKRCKSDRSESCSESCSEFEYLEGEESQSDQEESTEDQNDDRAFSCPAKSLLRSAKIDHLRRVDSTYLWNLPQMRKQLLSFNRKQDWKLLHDLYILFVKPKPCYIVVNWSSFKSASCLELADNFHNFKHRNGGE